MNDVTERMYKSIRLHEIYNSLSILRYFKFINNLSPKINSEMSISLIEIIVDMLLIKSDLPIRTTKRLYLIGDTLQLLEASIFNSNHIISKYIKLMNKEISTQEIGILAERLFEVLNTKEETE